MKKPAKNEVERREKWAVEKFSKMRLKRPNC